MLGQCHESVQAQRSRVAHFMVEDGFTRVALAGRNVRQVVLLAPHDDGGCRGIGSTVAGAKG